MMMAEKTSNMPASVSTGRQVMYGAMGSVAAVASLLAGTCLSRCNGCMGCLVGGTGLLGILTGSKMIERFSGARTGKSVPAADLGSEVKKREKGR